VLESPDGWLFVALSACGRIGGLFYVVLGLVLLKRLLERFFSKGVTLATVFSMLLFTNLLHYATGESVLSHGYSFFLLAAFLYLVPEWYAGRASPALRHFLVLWWD